MNKVEMVKDAMTRYMELQLKEAISIALNEQYVSREDIAVASELYRDIQGTVNTLDEKECDEALVACNRIVEDYEEKISYYRALREQTIRNRA